MASIPVSWLAALLVALVVQPSETGPPRTGTEEGSAHVGDAVCAGCHRDVAAVFSRTAHARAKGWSETHGCESCHGPALEHVRSGGASGIARLAELPPAEASRACVACHEGTELSLGSHHDLNEVSCTSCHSAHVETEQLLRAPEAELCGSCHVVVAGQFALPRHHPLSLRGRACTACHPAHGPAPAGPASAAETCTSCHLDVRGPFVYPHDVGVLEGCLACHEAHGSTNRHLLRYERQVDLCYSCHPGAATPSFHSFGRFLGEKCTACHTAIHGSNTDHAFLED